MICDTVPLCHRLQNSNICRTGLHRRINHVRQQKFVLERILQILKEGTFAGFDFLKEGCLKAPHVHRYDGILGYIDPAEIVFVELRLAVVALDFGALIGARGVCLRVGNMCASWAMEALGVSGAIRISVGGYNTMDDAKGAVQYIKDVIK